MSPELARTPRAAWKTIGFWMAAPIAALQAVNAARASLDPAGFAAYMGAPLEAMAGASWVQVYALRTAFIAILVAVFLLRGNLAALTWTAIAAFIMPLGDAWVAQNAGAPVSTVARHLGIFGYIALTAVMLHLSARAVARGA